MLQRAWKHDSVVLSGETVSVSFNLLAESDRLLLELVLVSCSSVTSVWKSVA